MAAAADVEYWLLEYACRYHHYKVIQGVSSRHKEGLSTVEVPPICLALPTLQTIVTNNHLQEFELAIDIVETIYRSCDNLVPFRLFAQLTSALKIKTLFHVLTTDKELILEKLNQYFPRSGLTYLNANKTTLSKLNKSSFEFRKFFLPLLANEKQRLSYLRTEYPKEFGESFLNRIQTLMTQFVTTVESHLPLTTLEQLMKAVSSGVDVERKLRELGVQSARIEIILDAVTNKTKLSSEALLDILQMVSPISSQDSLIPPHTLAILADQQDSEDSGTDQSPPLLEHYTLEMLKESISRPELSSIPEFINKKHGRFAEEHFTSSIVDNETSVGGLPVVHPGVTDTHRNKDLPVNTAIQRRRFSLKKGVRSKNDSAALDLFPGKGYNPAPDPTIVNSRARVSTSHHLKGRKRRNSAQNVSDRELQNIGNLTNADKALKRVKLKTVLRIRNKSQPANPFPESSMTEESSSSSSDVTKWSESDDTNEVSSESCDLGGNSLSDIDRSSQYDSECDGIETESDAISGSEGTELQSSHVSSSGEVRTDRQEVYNEKDLYSQLISPYRKNSVLKLCVVKLYKTQKILLDEQTGEEGFHLYS